MNNADLSRAVAEKLGKPTHWSSRDYFGRKSEHPYLYATDWSLIGPEIEKRYGQATFMCLLNRFVLQEGETLPRAACLAILEE